MARNGDIQGPARAGKPKASGKSVRAKKAGPGTRPGPAGTPASTRSGSSTSGEAKQARRDAILAAGLQVFAEHGFEAARLDDVAARAGVAKGTLYLYFTDKTALFEEIIRAAASPVSGQLEALAHMPDVPTRILLQKLFSVFRHEVLGTERKLVLRLVLSEGPRFPAIAQFYHAEVVSRGLGVLTRIVERGIARGEIRSEALAQFPQLVMAPLLVSLLWDGLFQAISPLDIERMLDTHVDLLTAPSPVAHGKQRSP
jgi:AcrR family transcriptional regulator